MATCASGQLPYVGPNGIPQANTPQEVCSIVGAAFSDKYTVFDTGTCTVLRISDDFYIDSFDPTKQCDAAGTDAAGTTISCGAECSITVHLKPAPPDAQNLADISMLFGLFLVAATVIFCARQLLNLFRVAPNED